MTSCYYMQVKLQMLVTELDICDFVIWIEHDVVSVTLRYDASSIASNRK